LPPVTQCIFQQYRNNCLLTCDFDILTVVYETLQCLLVFICTDCCYAATLCCSIGESEHSIEGFSVITVTSAGCQIDVINAETDNLSLSVLTINNLLVCVKADDDLLLSAELHIAAAYMMSQQTAAWHFSTHWHWHMYFFTVMENFIYSLSTVCSYSRDRN